MVLEGKNMDQSKEFIFDGIELNHQAVLMDKIDKIKPDFIKNLSSDGISLYLKSGKIRKIIT